MIYPNGILPAPPILLLHHLRRSGDLRLAALACVCVGHRDNKGYPEATVDKPFRTQTVKLLLRL